MKNIVLLLVSLTFAGAGYSQNSKKIKPIKFEAQVEASCEKIPGSENVSFSTKCKEGNVKVTFEDQRTSGTCAGDLLRTYIVEDACGNSKSFQQVINVVDKTAPSFIVLPPDLTFNNRVEYQDSPHTKFPLVKDNCSIDIIENIEVRSDIINGIPKLFKTYIAIDGCGNKSSHTQEITFNLEQ